MRLFEETGDERGIARTLWTWATLKANRGDAAGAIPFFEEAVAAFERNEDAWYHAMGLGSLAWCYFAIEDPREATRWAVQSLVEYHAMRDVSTTTITLAPSARVAFDAGRVEEAAVLLGAFEGLCEVYGVKPPPGMLHVIAGADIEPQVRQSLGEEAYGEAHERGRRLNLDAAVDLVVQICDRFLRSEPGKPQGL